MAGRLDSKIALITGAAGGIGSATARLFCREGAAVALVDMDRDKLDQTAAEIHLQIPGARVKAIVADVSVAEDTARTLAETLAEFGQLHVLVNNAAAREFYPLAEASEQSWKRIIGTNLMGCANCCKAALPALRKAGRASIVNVASVYGVVGRAGMGQYDATKAAILALTRALAVEEARYGIRVNAVCPGSTLTPFTLGRAKTRGMSEEELKQKGAAPSLLDRWAQPEEIAYPILWLASDEASFITGATLMVDGGLSAI
ncbi:MAG TPA: SDR family NAD(P)-dependent oxidoreductase [Candidatus Binatia bacterium]|jgi:meso-butanediol dehydrogenase/(S,S)-butanediol dehydrogenase/diacetyl reductase